MCELLHQVWLPEIDRMYCRDVDDVGGETSGTTRPVMQCHNPEDFNLHTQLHFQSNLQRKGQCEWKNCKCLRI